MPGKCQYVWMKLDAATALHRAGRHDEAYGSYRALLLSPNRHIAANAYTNMGSLMHEKGRRGEAEEAWLSAIELMPGLEAAHGNLATALLQRGQAKRAWQVLRHAVIVVPNSSALYTKLGGVLASSRSLTSLPEPARRTAVAIARVAVRLSPTTSKIWQNLGIALASVGGQAGLAGQAYRRAATLDPLVAECHLGLASSQPRAEAVQTLRSAIRLGPAMRGSRGALYHNLGNLLQSSRYDADAARMLAGGAGAGAAAGTAAGSVAGAAATAAAASKEATACFRRATVLQPSLSDAYYNAALAPQQAHLDEPSRAISDYTHAMRLAPRDSKVISRLVTTLGWAGRASEAAALAASAVRMGIYERAEQRPTHLVAGLSAWPWYDAENGYAAVRSAMRGAHSQLLDALDEVSSMGRMRPQPEGLQEAGQRWLVFDIGEACEGGGGGGDDDDEEGEGESKGEGEGESDESGGGGAGQGLEEEGAAGSAISSRLQPVCRLLASLRSRGAESIPPYAPLKAQFSTMAAGVHVRPHTGPTNAKLTLHYGLSVPEPSRNRSKSSRAGGNGDAGADGGSGKGGVDGVHGARIRVGDETRPFVARGLLAFDDSFEHEVWQDGDGDRTTLVLHVAHPDLPSGHSRMAHFMSVITDETSSSTK